MESTLENEIWRDIRGYEGQYQVSNYGNVRSLDRYVRFKDGRVALFKGKKRKLTKNGDGYLQVTLCPDSSTVNTVKVHRLVAETFIPNPNNMAEINHIDEIKTNNYVGNLEWCDRLHNCNHGTRNIRISHSHGIPVAIKGEAGVLTFRSYTEAAKFLGVVTETVRCAIKHGHKCRGYSIENQDHKGALE